ncbi:MAG: 2-oxoacid:acceptor oxidoreductase family protein [Armatimonadota bacterium]
MPMTEVVWHGRGGQGAKTASYILAEAAMEEGAKIQAFPEYGAERRGAPMKSYVRISDAPIRLRCAVTAPQVVVVLDPTLLGSVDVTEGLAKDGVLIVNTSEPPSDVRRQLNTNDYKLYTVDATKIALETIKRPIPNTPMLGALAKTTDLLTIKGATTAVRKKFQGKLAPTVIEGNVQAIERAHEEVRGE